ncbi:33075_t:CDS:1, partial [Racocetra persica]
KYASVVYEYWLGIAQFAMAYLGTRLVSISQKPAVCITSRN